MEDATPSLVDDDDDANWKRRESKPEIPRAFCNFSLLRYFVDGIKRELCAKISFFRI